MWYYAAPFRKENHTDTVSARVTTNNAAVEISKSKSCSTTHELQESYPTRTRNPNSNRTRNLLSAPCRLYSYLASVRPSTESEIEHQFDEARISTDSLGTSPGTSMAIVLSHMAAYMSYRTARCRARSGAIGPQLGVLYVNICLMPV